MNFGEYKNFFDQDLARLLTGKIKHVQGLAKNAEVTASLVVVQSLALDGGKRARPLMAEAMYFALGGADKQAARSLGLGLELFHLFCLVHDDVIDKGSSRHGVDTVQTAVLKRLTAEKRRGDLGHLANSQAVLIGDLLFSWAYSCILEAAARTSSATAVQEIFSLMIDDVVAGQMLDVDMMSRSFVTPKEVERKNMLKTATYSFVRPLEIGAALAGKHVEVREALIDFGTALGIGFQIQDDLFDVWSSEKLTGKPACADIADGAHTPLSAYIFAYASAREQREFLQVFGQGKLTKEEQRSIRIILERTGAKAATELEATKAFAKAKKVLDHGQIPPAVKAFLTELLNYVTQRKS